MSTKGAHGKSKHTPKDLKCIIYIGHQKLTPIPYGIICVQNQEQLKTLLFGWHLYKEKHGVTAEQEPAFIAMQSDFRTKEIEAPKAQFNLWPQIEAAILEFKKQNEAAQATDENNATKQPS